MLYTPDRFGRRCDENSVVSIAKLSQEHTCVEQGAARRNRKTVKSRKKSSCAKFPCRAKYPLLRMCAKPALCTFYTHLGEDTATLRINTISRTHKSKEADFCGGKPGGGLLQETRKQAEVDFRAGRRRCYLENASMLLPPNNFCRSLVFFVCKPFQGTKELLPGGRSRLF